MEEMSFWGRIYIGLVASDPQYKNGNGKGEQPEFICPYQTSHHRRGADSKGSGLVVVEDTDPH